jgi:AAA15 family ATPase/GTPase
MKLVSLKYKLTTNSKSNDWILEELSLDAINLLVGQNAVGKSSVMKLIINFSKLIKHQTFTTVGNQLSVQWSLVFETTQKDIVKYNLEIKGDIKILKESLYVNDALFLDRSPEKTELYSFSQKKLIKINPPESKLVLHIRRDIDEHPYFEDMIQWADGVGIFEFSKIRPFHMAIDSIIGTINDDTPYPNVIWKMLNVESKEAVISNFNSLGYKIADIILDKFPYRQGSDAIYVVENGLESRLSEYQLSQGMFRALALIVYIQYVVQNNYVSMILIDDLGEGLDYERATKLGKLLVEKLENSNIQFIATSNDSFLMDVIPIKYWNILQRKGDTVRTLNYHNSKERFDKFLMTGLSNFDLFSSDYLMRPKP